MKQPELPDSWKAHLLPEFEKNYMKSLKIFLTQELNTKTIYPPSSAIFKAFYLTPFDKVKVVILGQDPYHGPGQACGLCFAVPKGVPSPPSLQNIFKELSRDMNIPHLKSSVLSSWATQGVLLLNATLTVEKSKPGSHQNKGWETFTDFVIHTLNNHKKNVVFLLWGAYAQKKGAFVCPTKHLVLKASHPSPFSARAGFFNCSHFSKTNSYLKSKGLAPINWGANS